MGPVGQRYADGVGHAGHWITDQRRWFHESRKPLSANPGCQIKTGWLELGMRGLVSSGQLGAALSTNTAAQSPEVRQTGGF